MKVYKSGGLNEESREKDQEKPKRPETSEEFAGFILTSSPEWDMEQFVKDCEVEWGLIIPLDDDDPKKDTLLIKFLEEMQVVVDVAADPYSSEAIENRSMANYTWPEGSELVMARKNEVFLGVLNQQTDPIERGLLLTKLMTSALKQEGAFGVYTNGMAISKDYYLHYANSIKKNELPIYNWIWPHFHRDDERSGFCTFGLDKFGKPELEMYVEGHVSDEQYNEMRNFIMNLCLYIISEDITLNDGETVGFTDEQKCRVSVGKGILLNDDTVQIEYVEG